MASRACCHQVVVYHDIFIRVACAHILDIAEQVVMHHDVASPHEFWYRRE